MNNFESHLNPDDRIYQLELKKKELEKEITRLSLLNDASISDSSLGTDIAYLNFQNSEIDIEIKNYLGDTDVFKGLEFDGVSKNVAAKIESLMNEKQRNNKKIEELQSILNGGLDKLIDENLEKLKLIQDQLN